MPTSKRILFAAAMLTALPAASRAADEGAYRLAAQEVCFSDVLTLCADDVPDEGRIMACMSAQHAQLSAPCRKAFDAGMRARRRATR